MVEPSESPQKTLLGVGLDPLSMLKGLRPSESMSPRVVDE